MQFMRRMYSGLVMLVVCLLAVGCATVGGDATYTISGRLLEEGIPVINGNLAVSGIESFDPASPVAGEGAFGGLDNAGRFAIDIDGIDWEYLQSAGFPIAPGVMSIPPALEQVYVYYQRQPDQAWTRLTPDMRKADQNQHGKGYRWIRLGDLSLP